MSAKNRDTSLIYVSHQSRMALFIKFHENVKVILPSVTKIRRCGSESCDTSGTFRFAEILPSQKKTAAQFSLRRRPSVFG